MKTNSIIAAIITAIAAAGCATTPPPPPVRLIPMSGKPQTATQYELAAICKPRVEYAKAAAANGFRGSSYSPTRIDTSCYGNRCTTSPSVGDGIGALGNDIANAMARNELAKRAAWDEAVRCAGEHGYILTQ